MYSSKIASILYTYTQVANQMNTERSFSSFKRIQLYLRYYITKEESLNSLAIMKV